MEPVVVIRKKCIKFKSALHSMILCNIYHFTAVHYSTGWMFITLVLINLIKSSSVIYVCRCFRETDRKTRVNTVPLKHRCYC